MSAASLRRCTSFLATCASLVAGAANAGDVAWHFAVSLDGKGVGYHHFTVTQHQTDSGLSRTLHSEARFNVKVLFINAYRYAHESNEVWQDNCLERIESLTDDNGKISSVSGARQNDSMVVTTGKRSTALANCVLTFAYWNPQILKASRLLNPQTGEYISIAVTDMGSEVLMLKGGGTASEHFRLSGVASSGEPLRIDLWYSPAKEWLALESVTNGRHLRYQLQ